MLGVPIDVVTLERAVKCVLNWGNARMSKYVAVCNVHVVVSALKEPEFFAAVAGADLAVPDGAPVAWRLRKQGHREQQRIAGPDLMEVLLEQAAQEGVPVYFYGSTTEVLDRLVNRIKREHPTLKLAGMESPPFRPVTDLEDAATVERINSSMAGIVFVGLGCPKQERWMASHRSRVNAVMLGVGAAFDFYAGTLPRAPKWMQRSGLEWLHRLVHSPRRLARRYVSTNIYFLVAVAKEALLGHRS